MDDFRILIVEDNLADIRLTEHAIEKCEIKSHIDVVKDGVEAINFLRKTGKFSKVERPDLILLDLNLPKKNGLRVLKEIKEDADLKVIPVIILTISANEEDLLKAYNLHANCFIKKPLDINQFNRLIKSICVFWFKVVTLARI